MSKKTKSSPNVSLTKLEESNIKALLEKEEKLLILSIANFLFSIIPTLINVVTKLYSVQGSTLVPVKAVEIPLNLLGICSVGGFLSGSFDKIFKNIPWNKDTNMIEWWTNILFTIIYLVYIVIIPVCYAINLENEYITKFSLWTLLLRSAQCFVAVVVSIMTITKLARKLKK